MRRTNERNHSDFFKSILKNLGGLGALEIVCPRIAPMHTNQNSCSRLFFAANRVMSWQT